MIYFSRKFNIRVDTTSLILSVSKAFDKLTAEYFRLFKDIQILSSPNFFLSVPTYYLLYS